MRIIPVRALRGLTLVLLLTVACNAESPATPAPPATNLPLPATATPSPRPAWTMPEHRIGARALNGVGELYDRSSSERFVVRGANYVFVPVDGGRYSNLLLMVGIYDGASTRRDFARLAGLGYNTVRVFLDQCGRGVGCIGDADNVGLNPAYLDNIADMMSAAREAGLVILFTSNDLPDQGGYAEEANAQAGGTFGGYRNSYYLTPGAVSATLESRADR